jgi:hypothetical protein
MFKPYIMALWFAGLGFQLLLFLVLVLKKFWNKFPVFFAYSLLGVAGGAGLYFVRSSPSLYFYAYWVIEGLGLLLGFGVIFEVFKRLLYPYPALKKLAAIAFQTAIVLLITLGCIAAYLQPSAEKSRLVAGVFAAEEGTRIIEIGLLMFLFAFSTVFGLHWRQYTFGIALGLGLFVAVELIVVATRTTLGGAAAEILNVARSLGFTLSVLIWTGYALAPQRVTVGAELPKRAQLEQWNQAIMELIHQ